ncbi:GerMN domain-containing protein [Catelliglobosispora koreensis]|uniref:GerMN domain-containing protein n=1 Tax=Catelliglobosispora koreensis TaxID=129052 RepID=UPI0009FBF7CA|nr:GerMN domain-containing protein [Catelliglobosispora koreensis]
MRPFTYSLSLAVATSMLLAAGCVSRPPADPPATTTPPAPSASAATPAPAPGRQSLAVYYAYTPAGKGPRLVREFHQAPATSSTAEHVRAAVNEMLSGQPCDPDYRNLWPAGARVRAVTVAGTVASVDLGGAASASLGAEASAIAWQQLVWTVSAVPGVDAVLLLLDGQPAGELWGHLSIRGPQRRALATDVLHPVWLISPQHGDAVGHQTTLHIAAIAFEAIVNYEITREGVVIGRGFVTLNKGAPAQGEAKRVVTLDQPGTYVITAFLVSANDESRQAADDHTVTVGGASTSYSGC